MSAPSKQLPIVDSTTPPDGTVKVADPNPSLSPEMVKAQLAVSDPQLASAVIEGPVYDGDTATYTFTRSVGTKG